MKYYLPECGSIYKNGYFEANLVNLFVNLLEDGDIFFDVGAHVGYYSMLASSLIGERGRVVSFEPTPRTFGLLIENARSKKNIAIHNLAVLDEEREVKFYDYGPVFAALNSTTRSKRTRESRSDSRPRPRRYWSRLSLSTRCARESILCPL